MHVAVFIGDLQHFESLKPFLQLYLNTCELAIKLISGHILSWFLGKLQHFK